jgi:hypothetical protein
LQTEVERWQLPYLAGREAEVDSSVNVSHGVDRDGDSLVAEEVALVEEDVCHAMVAAVGDQSPKVSDAPIRCMDVVAAADFLLALGYHVMGDRARPSRRRVDVEDRATAAVRRAHLLLHVAPIDGAVGQRLRRLGLLERAECGHRAAQPDLLSRFGDEMYWHEAPGLSPVSWPDYEMRERSGDRVNQQSSELPAFAVRAGDAASSRELHEFAQEPSVSRIRGRRRSQNPMHAPSGYAFTSATQVGAGVRR